MGIPLNFEPQPGLYFVSSVGFSKNPDGSYSVNPGDDGGVPGSSSSNTAQRPNVAVAQTSIPLVEAYSAPRFVSLFNHGTNPVEIGYGPTVTAGNGFYVILPGIIYETPVSTTAAIAGISATGTNNVTPVEYL